MQSTKQLSKQKAKKEVKVNSLEQLGAIPQDIGKALLGIVTETPKKVNDDVVKGLFGIETSHDKDSVKSHAGELTQGQEVLLGKARDQDKKAEEEWLKLVHVEAGYDYRGEILNAEKRADKAETEEIKVAVEEIKIELGQLAKSTKELHRHSQNIIAPTPKAPGKYHLNFFSFMLSMLRGLRVQVEDSSAFLAALTSKKKQRQYGTMAKKHGTSFTLSNERVVATQTG